MEDAAVCFVNALLRVVGRSLFDPGLYSNKFVCSSATRMSIGSEVVALLRLLIASHAEGVVNEADSGGVLVSANVLLRRL